LLPAVAAVIQSLVSQLAIHFTLYYFRQSSIANRSLTIEQTIEQRLQLTVNCNDDVVEFVSPVC